MPGWRMRRSVMITPGHRPERLAKAVSLPADSLIFDLEDAVPPARKPEARAVVAQALTELSFGRRERAVRLNAIGSADFVADMAALPWASIDAVMLPKVERAEELHKLDATLDAGAPGRDIAVIATLETPRGILNALAIADASPRLAALFLGPGDYTMQTGGRITPRVLEFPRQILVAAAGAVGAQALDAPYLADLRDVAATGQDAAAARELGFSGKVVFHPDQIAPVNEAFTPSAEEVAKARRYIAAFQEAAAKGENLAYVDGTFIAMDLVPNMERILALAEAARKAASA
ncbi:MAG: CoA ester lyase [Roseomonas sp.]|nr:CoA ester lyase [Roseomonas sp.]MCA3290929.1 CoA ester lyase [Roseomonas sp.]MCA3295033.1 CoA ester lyase [Roseomonas sp.]